MNEKTLMTLEGIAGVDFETDQFREFIDAWKSQIRAIFQDTEYKGEFAFDSFAKKVWPFMKPACLEAATLGAAFAYNTAKQSGTDERKLYDTEVLYNAFLAIATSGMEFEDWVDHARKKFVDTVSKDVAEKLYEKAGAYFPLPACERPQSGSPRELPNFVSPTTSGPGSGIVGFGSNEDLDKPLQIRREEPGRKGLRYSFEGGLLVMYQAMCTSVKK